MQKLELYAAYAINVALFSVYATEAKFIAISNESLLAKLERGVTTYLLQLVDKIVVARFILLAIVEFLNFLLE